MERMEKMDNMNDMGDDDRLSPSEAAHSRAMFDAILGGAGYLKVGADGSLTRLDPKLYQLVEREPPKTRGRPAKWPFAGMEVDEWVQVAGRDASRAQNYVHTYGRKVGKRFTTRTTSEGDLIVRRVE